MVAADSARFGDRYVSPRRGDYGGPVPELDAVAFVPRDRRYLTQAWLAVFGLVVPLALLSGLSLLGLHISFVIPVWVGVMFAVAFFFLPDL